MDVPTSQVFAAPEPLSRAQHPLIELAARLAWATTGEAPVEERLEGCAEALAELLQLSFCGIWRVAERPALEPAALQLVAQCGSPRSLEWLDDLVGTSGEVRLAFERGEAELKGFSTGGAAASQPSDRAVLVLRAQGRVLGVLAAYSKAPLSDCERVALFSASGPLALTLAAARVERDRQGFRDLFLWMLGHDLRNPLNAISIGAHVLSHADGFPEATRRVAGNMQKSTQRIGRMITQLLDFARARAAGRGGLLLHRTVGDLRQAGVQALCEQRERFPGREVRESYAGNLEGSWDLERVTQALGTLINNALQHGDQGSPVELAIERREDHVLARVHSFGDPISRQRQAVILDPFQHPGRIKGRGSEALGIGLFVAREIALAHGGELCVESSEQSGTCFSLRLPTERTGG